MTLYYTLIYLYLNYCIICWGHSAKVHLTLLTKCQNYFLRVLFFLKKFDHVSLYYKTSNILNLTSIFKLRLLIFMFKITVKKISPFFNVILSKFISKRIYSTRIITTFSLPKCRTSTYRHSTFYQGMYYWNMIPQTIIKSHHAHSFKLRIYKLIQDNYFPF